MKIKELSPGRRTIHSQILRIRFLMEYAKIKLFSGTDLHKKRLKKILSYAVNHCTYYKEMNLNPNDIGTFPLLTKDIIRQRYNDIMSDESNRIIYRESYTGGSTGQPLYFLNQMDYDPVYQVVFWQRMGYRHGNIILSMDGTKIPEEQLKQNIFWGEKNRRNLPYGGYYLSSLYLNDNNIALYVDYIKRLRPDFIRAYPMFIYTIAKYMRDNGITVDHHMKGIQLTSESSFQYQHELIEEVFQTTVFLQYGHTECCIFAYTKDKTRKYYTEPLYGYTEILDKEGNHVKIGETGEIVVSTYFNKVMPLIRYKTGDRGEFGGYYKNAMIINHIEGRTQDYVVDNNGQKIMVTALVMAQHCKALGHINKWQIEQTEKGTVTMRIIKGKDYTADSENELYHIFWDNSGITVNFEYVDTLPLTERGKSKLVIQHL